MSVTARELDFSKINDQADPLPVPAIFGKNGALVMSRKQMRQRIRRDEQKKRSGGEMKRLYKPVQDWDVEELAMGRPRDKNGQFRGRAPKWITRELHEEAMTRFRQVVRDDMNALTPTALKTIEHILSDDELDDRGRPHTPMNVKLTAATLLVEHVLGKPKQRVETDISVKMQGMLATVLVTGPDVLPAMPGSMALTSPRDGVIDVPGREQDDDD